MKCQSDTIWNLCELWSLENRWLDRLDFVTLLDKFLVQYKISPISQSDHHINWQFDAWQWHILCYINFFLPVSTELMIQVCWIKLSFSTFIFVLNSSKNRTKVKTYSDEEKTQVIPFTWDINKKSPG